MKLSQHIESDNISKIDPVFLSVCVVAVMLLLIIIALTLYICKIRRKSSLALAHQASNMTEDGPILCPDEKNEVMSDEGESNGISLYDASNNDADYRLFLLMDRKINEQLLFLNPELNRMALCELISVDKNRMGRILKRYSGEANLTAYINRKRMIYAAHQMLEHPEWSIRGVAQSSGITNLATFNRLFRQHFHMSPTKYIKNYPERTQ